MLLVCMLLGAKLLSLAVHGLHTSLPHCCLHTAGPPAPRLSMLACTPHLQDPYSHPLVSDPLPQVSSQYYDALAAALHYRSAEANASAPPMVYTAMHGVGTPWVQEVGGVERA